MYKPKNYELSELAHPQIIKAIGVKNTWRRLDEQCLRDMQTINDEWRKIHNSGIYCNRLNLGLDSRGLRPPNDPDGSFYSTHKNGNTFDLEPVNGKIEELYKFIIQLIKDGKLLKLNTLENFADTVKWVHVGYMNTTEKPLIIFL
ncbi:hypothetical protein [Bizionia myxarmorum]|uniref:Peptidase M15A C-terminal domain-containing protein n=1 Tax=Bizionia myxarmorum TaxID=291186 RepID=A0A5D0RBQ2_9FLAO|nr:hypothetical protein [Bizionia myxarmorum]TYB78341.1 hypothetical protein ES674_00745 [Bizionia myxarmorum]